MDELREASHEGLELTADLVVDQGTFRVEDLARVRHLHSPAEPRAGAEGAQDREPGGLCQERASEAGGRAHQRHRAIGEDALASSRQSLELAANNAKSLAAATSPTEFFQLQTELARASFDRMVAQSSKMTEQVVKLAGEAIQPISTRASVSAERINELMA